MPSIIGIDIGTTSTIGILIDLPKRIVAIASRPVDLVSLHPSWAEEDPEQWWRNACAIVRELLAAEPRLAGSLAGIGVAGMVPAVVLLDTEGNLLRRSMQQSDGRCGAEVEELAREIDGERFLARTGNGITQQIVAAKLRWIRRHEPEIFSRIDTVFGSYDYINWKLTGRRTLEHNWALEAGFVDLADGEIAPDLVALAGIAPSALPPLLPSHAVLGQVSATAAAECGLPKGLPVVAGAADHIASAYAAGEVGGRPQPHTYMDQLAAAVPPGSDGVVLLPYFLGEKSPIQDPLARGSITGLSLSHRPAHLWRAALESAGYAFRHHIEVFRELGYPVRRLLASDGGSRSAVWMQIVADIIGLKVQLLEGHPGSCLGAAWVAAIGTGASSDWAGVSGLVQRGLMVEPNPSHAAIYDAGYRRFRDLYDRLAPWFAGAADA